MSILKTEQEMNNTENQGDMDLKPINTTSRSPNRYSDNFPMPKYDTTTRDIKAGLEIPILNAREPSPPTSRYHSDDQPRNIKAIKPKIPPFQSFSAPNTSEIMDYPSPPPPTSSSNRIPISAARTQIPTPMNSITETNPASPQLPNVYEHENSYDEFDEEDNEDEAVAIRDRMAIDFLRSVRRGSSKHKRQRSHGHGHSHHRSKETFEDSRRERVLPHKLVAKRPEAPYLSRQPNLRTVNVNLVYTFAGDDRNMTEEFRGVQVAETSNSEIFELNPQWLMSELYRFLPDFLVSCFKVRAKTCRNPEQWVSLGSTGAIDDLRPIPVLHAGYADYCVNIEFIQFDMPAMAYRAPKHLPPVYRLLDEQKYQISLLGRDSAFTAITTSSTATTTATTPPTANTRSHELSSPTSPVSPILLPPVKRPASGGDDSDSRAKRTRATDLKTWLENFRSVRAALKVKSEKTHNAVYRREEHSQPNFSLKRPYVRYIKKYLRAVNANTRARDSTLDGMLANARDYRPIQLMNYVRGLPDFDRKELQKGDDTDTDSESQYI